LHSHEIKFSGFSDDGEGTSHYVDHFSTKHNRFDYFPIGKLLGDVDCRMESDSQICLAIYDIRVFPVRFCIG